MKTLPKEFFEKARPKTPAVASNIIPFKWSDEVFNGNKKVIINSVRNAR